MDTLVNKKVMEPYDFLRPKGTVTMIDTGPLHITYYSLSGKIRCGHGQPGWYTTFIA